MVLPEAPRKHRRSLTGESPETMKEIRLLALDIDGTILTREKRLTNRTRAAIEAAADAGIAVSLVTGRPFCGIPEELLSLKGLGYVISSNGAVTTDLKLRRILRSANLDPETALEIISIPRTHALVYAVFMDGMGFSEPEPFERHLGMIDNPGLETYVRGSRRVTCNLEGDIRKARNGVENIWFIARDRQERDALNRQICERWNVRTVLTEKTDLEIGCLQADKGLAPATQRVTAGDTAVRPEDPTANYYAFKGWYTDVRGTEAFDFNTPIYENTVLYAKWQYTGKGPKTGDESNTGLWIGILAASAVGLAGAGFALSKKKKK